MGITGLSHRTRLEVVFLDQSVSLTSDFMAPAALQVSASHAPRLLHLDSSSATTDVGQYILI